MKIIFCLLIVLIASTYELQGQVQNIYCNEFTITQNQSPSWDFEKYIFKKNKLFVYKNSKLVYKQKLNTNQLKSLDSILVNIEISSLETMYNRRLIDGTGWKFNFLCNELNKEIYLGNYYHPKLDILLKYINKQMPKKKRMISFNNGYFTNLESESDTSIIFLPDFYINKVIMPDSNYDYYNIICFKKGYLVSNDIDSIIECECRIYPSDFASNTITKRKFWVCTRINDTLWEKVYYDDDNKIINEFRIEEIRPFEFLDLGVFNNLSIRENPGDRPSVIIYKYYRTIQKNNR